MLRRFRIVLAAIVFLFGLGQQNQDVVAESEVVALERGVPQEPPSQQRQQGQAGESSAGQDFSVSGMVVDSVTGKPVGHALVVLYVGGRPQPRRVMAEEDGRFEIDGIREGGKGSIEAFRPGYFSSRTIRRSRYSSMGSLQDIAIVPGANFTVTLTPEATIAGRVVDESGEPIEGLPIHLDFEAAEAGRRFLRLQDQFTTDEEGEFRFANLLSGRYFVTAGPSEETGSENSAKGHTALGYPMVFYGGGADIATASPIDLTAGRHVELDLRVAVEPFFHVTGTIIGAPPHGLTQLMILDAAHQRVETPRFLQNINREEPIAVLPRGHYTIQISSRNGQRDVCSVAVKGIDLTRDLERVPLMMTPCAVIPVNLQIERTAEGLHKDYNYLMDSEGALPPGTPHGARIVLHLKDDPTQLSRFTSWTEQGDEPRRSWIRNVLPGTYYVEILPLPGLYVESAQSGLTDLRREDLVVPEGASIPPIEIRLRDDGAELSGTIRSNKEDGAAVAIAIPEGMEREAKIAMAKDRQYQFKDLAPGTYRVMGVDRVDDFAYSERDAVSKYLAHAKEVTLRPNDKATLDVEFIHVGRGVQ
jgi:hypothetical protein